MQPQINALKAAFPHTIPVMTGFLFLGFAFGILMNSKGYSVGWSVLMSAAIYAGSMQFVAVGLLSSAFNPLNAFIMTLIINARHLFYGLSMIKKFSTTGRKRTYLVFGLVDETFSILCSTEPPAGIDQGWFMFFVTLLNNIYWVTGTILGGILGSMVAFNTKGIDFVMTALFVVIFINQWKSQERHSPALIGVVASTLCLLLFGASNFIIPAMIVIIVVLTWLRKTIETGVEI